MKLTRTNTGIYKGKHEQDGGWVYRFVMDDFGNAVMLGRNIQNYMFFYE